MPATEPHLTACSEALPQQFEFYHLGNVTQFHSAFNLVDPSGVAFRIYGDFEAVLAVLFDSALDYSTYAEFGNLLASGLTTQLHKKHGWDLMISPPQKINPLFLKSLLALMSTGGSDILRKSYLHNYNGLMTSVETLVLPMSDNGVGYA